MSTIVVGSGPAGIAAASALVEAGESVTIVDVGGEVEPERMELFDSLAPLEPAGWPPGIAHRMRESFPVGVKSVGLKPAYGSLFPYAVEDPDLPVALDHAETLPSLARGGLSNTWGASMLPFRQSDIGDWPISTADLAPHYEAVLRFVPLAGERDGLEAMYPLYGSPRPLERYPQVARVLDHLGRHETALHTHGFTFGASRLAVHAGPDDERRCRMAGLCMYGCPYHSIYSAGQTLAELLRTGRVQYRSGVFVHRLQESEGRVRLFTRHRDGSGTRDELEADRVFVACGTISSTRLMLESIGSREPRRLVDSQYYLMPLLTARATAVSAQRQGNTLAQVFLELEDTSLSAYTVHLQLYPYNDLMVGALASRVPVSPERLERGLRPLLGRMIVAQGYIHSRESPGLILTPSGAGVKLTGERGPSAAGRVARRLAANARPLGLAPIPGLIQPGAPGKGNHLGGSLPMRENPGPLESDVLGRPTGFQRVHVVDASVLPSIPASTVTLSVMANAHRIATESRRLRD